MAKRAAVVIGVDKTGKLTKLKSAAKGAEAVAHWLRGEKYDVECLTDQSRPVGSRDVEDALLKFVTVPPRYTLLVVYFSGHGYWHARSDRWLLSGAPVRTSDAINLDGAMDLARYSGIPNVVFISDACRSIPDSSTAAKVTGVDAFPNYDQINKISKIDFFKATSEARSAYEGKVEGKHHSILTYALMSAYEAPSPEIVRQVKDGAARVDVVPNRELEIYLQNKVNDILAGIDINLTQNIEANVPSGDDVYIARAHNVQPASPANRRSGPRRRGGPRRGFVVGTARAVRIGQAAAAAIERTLAGSRPAVVRVRRGAEAVADVDPSTEAQMQAHMPGEDIDHLESRCGFHIRGARVVDVAVAQGDGKAWAEILEQGDGYDTPAIVRLWEVRPAVSIAIELEDGRSTIVAGLDGYIGHASFDENGLANVSYVPSSNHPRWRRYERKRAKIDRLRALAALAISDNSFQIRSDKEANALGQKIRMEKSVDPTLGLYAAHAFSQMGSDDRLRSVRSFMRQDLQTDLFDVRVLTTRRGDGDDFPYAPCCPMLTQTWNLLRPRGFALPAVLQNAAAYLCDSLWTTFHGDATADIMHTINTGELL